MLTIRQSGRPEYNRAYMRYANLDEATNALLLYAPNYLPGKYDLSVISQLMELVGNPQERLRVIHVAGTSGKTSTCYYIRALLELSGCRTGMTVSPHITAINERVQVDGQPLNEQQYLNYLDEFLEIVRAGSVTPSYYEITMAFAYYVFDKEHVDYAVIETGLGGLVDGSNVASRADKVCAIQRIGYDHTEILGETIEDIALQKAGIIHQDNTVFVLEQTNEAIQTIINYARTKKASITIVPEKNDPEIPVAYQHANWSLAVAVYQYIMARDHLKPLDTDQLSQAKKMTAPGRYEVHTYKNKRIILDGAHNEQKLNALFDSLYDTHGQNPVVIFSVKGRKDKKVADYLMTIKGHCSTLIFTGFHVGQDSISIQNVDLDYMKNEADKLGIPSIVIADQAMAIDHAMSQDSDTILITGSLYLISEIRKLIVD
jgi:dihydrofolate synthase/folylpolyglutamate synthase